MEQWNRFIRALDSEITWNRHSRGDVDVLESILTDFWPRSACINSRIAQLTSDDELFNFYEPHQEVPRLFMDKFLLYMDPKDRYRVRLHRWKTKVENRGLIQEPHDHRWHFSTLLLKGNYRETLYHADHLPEENFKLTVLQEKAFGPGDVHSMAPAEVHCAVNESDTDECYSLFVRGTSFLDSNKTYYLANNKYIERTGRSRLIKDGLKHISGELIAA
jgi:predicted metal-dependent enzyme (double-stranded beta helix superfamily)